MVLKCFFFGTLLRRNISTSQIYKKVQQTNRFKRMTVTNKSSSNKMLDLKGEKNRTAWLKSIEEEETVKGKIANSNVYMEKEFEKIKYSFEDATQFHQEYLLDKALYDSPNSVLKVNYLLNMKTKKVTKFVQKFQGIETPAHPFTFLTKPKILAFCTTQEDIDCAISLGALEAGDEALAKKLEQGHLFYEEFDQVVCHTEASSLLSKLKSVLKDKLPTKQNNRIGPDIKSLVETYINGYEFESKKLEGIPEEAILSIPIGEISWPMEKLKENFLVFMRKIVLESSPQIAGSPISKISLICPPSDEIFFLDFQEDFERFAKMRQKSKLREEEE